MKKILIFSLIMILLCVPACQKETPEPSETQTSQPSETTEASSSVTDSDWDIDFGTEEGREYLRRMEEEHLRQMEEDKLRATEILAAASDKPYQQLITRTYSEEIAFKERLVYRMVDSSGRVSYMETSLSFYVDKLFPVECLRKTSETTAYALYKTDEGGLIYLFVKDDDREIGGSWMVTHGLYTKKNLKKSDFKFIRTGNSIQKVNRIDPTVELYLNRWNKRHSQEEPYATAHLCQDGIMIIHYTYKKGEYKVKKKDFFDDFIVDYCGKIFDCRILEQDVLQ